MNNRPIYIIPIRSGSKGIPNKNMKILGGKPLVAWILDSIIGSGPDGDIWVATDSDKAETYIFAKKDNFFCHKTGSLSVIFMEAVSCPREFV